MRCMVDLPAKNQSQYIAFSGITHRTPPRGSALNLAEDLANVTQDDEFGRKLQDAKLLDTDKKGGK